LEEENSLISALVFFFMKSSNKTMKVFLSILFLMGLISATIAQDANTEFSNDIQFSSTVNNLEDLLSEIKTTSKPAVVFVTQPWCGACKNLKRDINNDENLKKILNTQVIAVHATGKQADSLWQKPGEDKQDYIPRVYFLNTNGQFVEVPPANTFYPHFFASAGEVTKGLEQVMAGSGLGEDL